MNRRATILSVYGAVNALLIAGLFLGGRGGWKGTPNDCIARGTCFCEEFREGPVKQPANTFSNVAFILVGLACALHAARNGKSGAGRLQSTDFHPALFCAALGALGPGSMYLHASMTRWGGRMDVASMDVFMGVCAAFGLSRRFRWRRGVFACAALSFTAAPLLAEHFFENLHTEHTFGVLIAVFLAAELLPGEEASSRLPDKTWLKRAGACFFAAFSVWLLSRRPTSPLCSPRSLLQGHAFWHIMTALGAGCLYPYLLQERAWEESPARAPAAEPALD
jgi:hypothetical protein